MLDSSYLCWLLPIITQAHHASPNKPLAAPAFSKAQRLDQLFRRQCFRKLFPEAAAVDQFVVKRGRRTMLHIDDGSHRKNLNESD